jgi:hypothetical protein
MVTLKKESLCFMFLNKKHVYLEKYLFENTSIFYFENNIKHKQKLNKLKPNQKYNSLK